MFQFRGADSTFSVLQHFSTSSHISARRFLFFLLNFCSPSKCFFSASSIFLRDKTVVFQRAKIDNPLQSGTLLRLEHVFAAF